MIWLILTSLTDSKNKSLFQFLKISRFLSLFHVFSCFFVYWYLISGTFDAPKRGYLHLKTSWFAKLIPLWVLKQALNQYKQEWWLFDHHPLLSFCLLRCPRDFSAFYTLDTKETVKHKYHIIDSDIRWVLTFSTWWMRCKYGTMWKTVLKLVLQLRRTGTQIVWITVLLHPPYSVINLNHYCVVKWPECAFWNLFPYFFFFSHTFYYN